MADGEELSQDWKADTPENRHEGQTLPLRQVPEAKPEACQDAGPVNNPADQSPKGFSSRP
jgi:hypothetical protein